MRRPSADTGATKAATGKQGKGYPAVRVLVRSMPGRRGIRGNTRGMIQAELTDGCIVALEQDCACQTHEGPHWLHMNDVERCMNRQTVEHNLGNTALWRWYVQAECERLAALARHYARCGIARIIRE